MNACPSLTPLFLTGPTGSGKSALALEVAGEIGAEIVNADAFQIYRGMEILTAQPSAADRLLIPHHLYGCHDAADAFDVGLYAVLAAQAIAGLQSRGVRPLVVGGSGMYVKSLTHGLADLPPANTALRRTFDSLTISELQEWLCRVDPAAPDQVNLQNARHVQRALEISLLTGRPASEFKHAWKQHPPAPRGVFLHPPRAELYARINQRAERMFEQGVAAEVARLSVLSATAEKAIGLREIRQLQTGILTPEQALAVLQQATRRYAKRQITWFKRESCLLPTATAAEAKSQLIALHRGGQS
ncbi:MAG: tRNA (adenosine(37)-N6)-dimethylallyltransferase MiaA [Verrucomicrobiales bacterium]|nr:tRNA (adenosine(37)-N6)-dimethylallyltransferase MiaA [Verrucomicrobiales bacterium]